MTFTTLAVDISQYLSAGEKHRLLEQGIVLCRELMRRDDLLAQVPVSGSRIPGVLQECRNLCDSEKRGD